MFDSIADHTHETLDRFASSFEWDWGTRLNHQNVFKLGLKVQSWVGWFLNENLSFHAKLGSQASLQ